MFSFYNQYWITSYFPDSYLLKAHSDELHFPCLAASDSCIAAKNRKSLNFCTAVVYRQTHVV